MAPRRQAGAAALLAIALLAGCTADRRPDAGGPGSRSGGNSASADPRATVPPPGPSSVLPPSTPAPSPKPAAQARQAMAALARHLPAGAVSVAVRDETTGTSYAFGAGHGMWTGSVYKLLVLETLLMQRQRSHDWFTSGELADITAMIERSDNKAGYRMFLDAGGNSALAAAARRLGMRHTLIGESDPTFTTLSGRDGLKLVECLVRPGLLSAHSRAFVLSLMRSVEADQRWGVGVLADPGTAFENKNGWLAVDDDNGPGEDDNDRWVASSVGIVRMHGRQLLVSVFTQHNSDFASGVRLVERLARLAAKAVLPAGASGAVTLSTPTVSS